MNAIPPQLERLLAENGVEVVGRREISYGTQYHLVRGAEKNNLNVYRTGKVSADGKPSTLKDLLEGWRVSTQGNGAKKTSRPAGPVSNSTPRVGTDEAGKGEYLGPLVVAGARVLGEEQDWKLRKLGVRDSKSIRPNATLTIAAKVKRLLGADNFRVVSLPPPEYEKRRKDAGANVNRLLGELNAEIINELEAEVKVAVVDEFGRKAGEYVKPRLRRALRLDVRQRADESDAAVAAASILARARYLEEMERLSERVGFELPRAAAHRVEAAQRVVEERGVEGLSEVAKVHFATTATVLESAKSAGGGR